MITIYSDREDIALSVWHYVPAWAFVIWTRLYVFYLMNR
jgi:hypothetical protein